MTTTAIHNTHGTTSERVLFVAFALREKTWKLGCTMGHRQKHRERGVAACHQARVPPKLSSTRLSRGLPPTSPLVDRRYPRL